jgi:hypothetical protein
MADRRKIRQGRRKKAPRIIADKLHVELGVYLLQAKGHTFDPEDFRNLTYEERQKVLFQYYRDSRLVIRELCRTELANRKWFWDFVERTFRSAEKASRRLSLNELMGQFYGLALSRPEKAEEVLLRILEEPGVPKRKNIEDIESLYFDVQINPTSAHFVVGDVRSLPESVKSNDDIKMFSRAEDVSLCAIQSPCDYELDFIHLESERTEKLSQKRRIETFVFICLNRHEVHTSRSIIRFLNTHQDHCDECDLYTDRNTVNVALTEIRKVVNFAGGVTIPNKVGSVVKYYFICKPGPIKLRVVLRSNLYTLVRALGY